MKNDNNDNVSPLVTVLLPVYNGEETLDIAIKSIVDQSYNNIELVIIDDGSTDGSKEIARHYINKNTKLIENRVNSGLSSSLNTGVDIAGGAFIARMDQDDICHPKRIEKQVEFMQENPNIDLLATSTLVFQAEDKKILGFLPVKERHDQICISPVEGFLMPHPTWLGKSEWFAENCYLPETNGAEDQNLLFRSYEKSKFACLLEPLLAYREPRRRLRKMLRARYIFARSNASTAWYGRKPSTAIKIVIWQLMKSLADVLNILLRVPSMRNTLIKPDKVTMKFWEQVLK